jgi:uncharacterized membrane protein
MGGASSPLVALAALCWGISGGIGGILMGDGWNAIVVSLYRGAIGLLFVLVWLALHPHGSGLANHRFCFWAAIAGLGVAGNFVFHFVSIAEGTVAVAATLMYCAPVFVYLLSFALRLDRKPLGLQLTRRTVSTGRSFHVNLTTRLDFLQQNLQPVATCHATAPYSKGKKRENLQTDEVDSGKIPV